MLKRYLMHDRLVIRFGSLLIVAMILFLVAWTASYIFLPEGVLRGRLVGQAAAGNDLLGGSVFLEWLRILGINLVVLALLIVAPNLLRNANDYPLGYTTVLLLVAINGITLGTNSFAISMGGKIPPSLEILRSSGLYEIAAYILACVATISISKYRLVGTWPKQKMETIENKWSPADRRERNAGVFLSIALLVIACGWEAFRISIAVGT